MARVEVWVGVLSRRFQASLAANAHGYVLKTTPVMPDYFINFDIVQSQAAAARGALYLLPIRTATGDT